MLSVVDLTGSGIEDSTDHNQEQRPCRVADVRHIGIVVSDMTASLAFYIRFFGLRLGNRGEEMGPELDRILGMTNVRLCTQKLLCDTGTTRLELIEFLEPKQMHGAARVLINVGITHFAITVHDIELMYREMSAEGVPFISRPLMEATGFAKVAFCSDPDGNLIELIEVQ